MSQVKVEEFIQHVERDPELTTCVRALNVTDQGLALIALAKIAAEAGFDLSPAALEAGLKARAVRELSDGDLDAVAGGIVGPTDLRYSPSLQTSAFSSFYTGLTGIIMPID